MLAVLRPRAHRCDLAGALDFWSMWYLMWFFFLCCFVFVAFIFFCRRIDGLIRTATPPGTCQETSGRRRSDTPNGPNLCWRPPRPFCFLFALRFFPVLLRSLRWLRRMSRGTKKAVSQRAVLSMFVVLFGPLRRSFLDYWIVFSLASIGSCGLCFFTALRKLAATGGRVFCTGYGVCICVCNIWTDAKLLLCLYSLIIACRGEPNIDFLCLALLYQMAIPRLASVNHKAIPAWGLAIVNPIFQRRFLVSGFLYYIPPGIAGWWSICMDVRLQCTIWRFLLSRPSEPNGDSLCLALMNQMVIPRVSP
jgi:hypothetical protein